MTNNRLQHKSAEGEYVDFLRVDCLISFRYSSYFLGIRFWDGEGGRGGQQKRFSPGSALGVPFPRDDSLPRSRFLDVTQRSPENGCVGE